MPKKMMIILGKRKDRSYTITIGMRLADCVDDILRSKIGNRYFIITDPTVKKLYGATLLKRMKLRGATCSALSVPAGERFKSRSMKGRLEDRMLALGADRDSVVIALGVDLVSRA